ncbi:hypothetical protein [Haloarchaeobius amylolyticus]|uniref:hypothetical protein n=1 Tax=Haloarchaeobius amylolyticus TaxID=1198296 RepID=UPI00226F6FCE|nr:hypothetical protein [Haloarchaeobius amylolyticus]
MGLLDSLRELFRSPPSDPEPEPAERATPASDPDRMYGTPPDDDDDGFGLPDEPGDEPEERPTEPPEAFAYEAQEFVDFWHEYPLDFTLSSLAHLDSLVTENWEPEAFAGVQPTPDGGSDARTFYGIVQSIGSYVGETLVRDCDGEWTEAGSGNWAVVVEGPEGQATVAVFSIAAEAFTDAPHFRSFVEKLERETGV